MPGTILTEARVKALKPRKSVREVRDGKLRGFGVRVSPSGRKQFFIYCQHQGERIWKIVGDAGTVSVGEARSLAGDMLVSIRSGEDTPHAPDETLFEVVAEAAFQRHERVWKPGTLAVNRNYLHNRIMPHFAGRQAAEIDRQEVRNWFARLRATPVAADRSLPILSVIMREAERMGMRPEGSNPCRGIRRYRRKGRERFLSDNEVRRLSERLKVHEASWPQQAAVIRLLLLTGCRKGEILTLLWTDYRDGHLFLRTARQGRGPLRSTIRLDAFSTGTRAATAHSSFPHLPTLHARAILTCRSGTGFGGKPALRTYASMTYVIRMRATPS